jgi:excisionase family DNA binding protein
MNIQDQMFRALTTADIARRLNVSGETVRGMIRRGEFEGVFTVSRGKGAHHRVPLWSWQNYLAARGAIPGAPKPEKVLTPDEKCDQLRIHKRRKAG